MINSFNYNAAIELITAFHTWSSWDNITKEVPEGMIPEEIAKWKDDVDDSFPIFIQEMSHNFSSNFILLIFSLVKFIVAKEIKNVEIFLSELKDMTSEDLLSYMILGEGFPFSESELLRDPTRGKQVFESSYSSFRPRDGELFENFLTFPEFYKKQLFELLSIFYTIAVEPYEKKILLKLESLLNEDLIEASENEDLFLSRHLHFTKSCINELPRTIFLTYYGFFDVVYFNDPNIVIYGWKSQLKNTFTLEDFFNVFNDESRRKILQLLYNKPMYSREIANFLGLSPSTISYHISRLYTHGLISYQTGPGKKIVYAINKIQFEQVFKQMREEIILFTNE